MEESTGGNHTTTLAARTDVAADLDIVPDWSRVDDRDVDSEDEQVDERRTHPAVAGGGKKLKRKGPGLNVPLEEFIKDNPEVVGDEPARPRRPRGGGGSISKATHGAHRCAILRTYRCRIAVSARGRVMMIITVYDYGESIRCG